MNDFLKKRDDLEQFIREQIIGPGAFNKRYFLLADWDNCEFSKQSIKNCKAIDNRSEIITEVPAYQYSSAILFPKTSHADVENTQGEQSSISLETDENPIESIDDNSLSKYDEKTESLSSKNQNYPNTFGLSFALSQGRSIRESISCKISFRVYKQLSKKQCLQGELGYWINENHEEIKNAIDAYFKDVFEVKEKDSNYFVISKEMDFADRLYEIDYALTENYKRERIIPILKEQFPNDMLFEETTREYNNRTYQIYKIFDEELIELIKTKGERGFNDSLLNVVKELTIYYQIKEIVTDLKTIYKKSNSTPVWQATSYLEDVLLPDYNFSEKNKQVGEVNLQSIKDNKGLKLYYQYLLHRNGRIYIKLILVNENELKLKEDDYWLNKKDSANICSFFGVTMTISENAPNSLVPYNPPNLLDIDEEENLNKILYRQFEDFGEGYNTSICWGNKDAALKFISTEYIPSHCTPSVDYRPTKFGNGVAQSRIKESLLSFKGLSTLSDESDEQVLKKLENLVDSYRIWIEEKQATLEMDNKLDQMARGLLTRQINACQSDYKRLSRNITLLRKDKKAMAAFRVMNTAMFMQLHHKLEVEKAILKSGTYLPEQNSHEYYKNLRFENGNDYKWRAFQLAFILLNIDGFVRPSDDDKIVQDVFGTNWPERNEIADLVWFPTGGGKTEAYLGIIAFCIVYRRFMEGDQANGVTVLMRYTLRLLTLQQFQRASLLICALEAIRLSQFPLPIGLSLGNRITIGLFVGSDSLPNKWQDPTNPEKGMTFILKRIEEQIRDKEEISTNLPHINCPWCGGNLFVDDQLKNISPHWSENYGINDKLSIGCNSKGCVFNDKILGVSDENCLPLRLFDEDIYKFPPTLLFGTVDKFAALSNSIDTDPGGRNKDSRRLFGIGYNQDFLPPDLIIQDELHLLLGPLGSAVGLFEKAIDDLCSRRDEKGFIVKPKIITSTATTRNTDAQIFALFNRRSEIFPKQGIQVDDSFFSNYKRNPINEEYISLRKYLGFLPIGKTQVWMQMRLASIALAHRLKFIEENFTIESVLKQEREFSAQSLVLDYFHTVLSYYNSIKEVGKTQSQLSHYLPGDLNLVIKNTTNWSILNAYLRGRDTIEYSELTGRLSGKEVRMNFEYVKKQWKLFGKDNPPEFVIATNMISVGLDIPRFNTMIINSMPRNTAEYIQSSSRVSREREGIVLTVHHPFRSRDISHYQRFKEFHEKFYSSVEPISITPFAQKALERYLAMYLAAVIRNDVDLGLGSNSDAKKVNANLIEKIIKRTDAYFNQIHNNVTRLNEYLQTRNNGIHLKVHGVIGEEELHNVLVKIKELLLQRWLDRIGDGTDPTCELKYRDDNSRTSLFDPKSGIPMDNNWHVINSLREIPPSSVIKTVQQ